MVLAPAVLIVHIDMYVKSTTGGCDVVVMSEFCSVCFCFVGVGGVVRVVCTHSDLGVVGIHYALLGGGGQSLGPVTGRNSMSVAMSLETPREKAVICSWMYIRKVSERHLPIFLIWISEQPLRCMAIAPPARREWLLMSPFP